MITSNATEVAKSLTEYQTELKRKLTNMVAGFAGELTQDASNSTRIGHISEGGNTAKYIAFYKQRARPPSEGGYGIAPIEGFHKGAWVYTEGSLSFDPTIHPADMVKDTAIYKARAEYKIGDKFSIGAIGTAYGMLQRLDDIEGVTLQAIMNAHKVNLLRYFNEG